MNALPLRHSLLLLVARGLADVVEPKPPIAPSLWARENLMLPDGEYAGQKIDFERVPHIAEPMDMLGPDSPANEVGVMKNVQSAFTTALLGVIGHRIDREPCDMLIVQPTDGALSDFNSTKLNRMIEATEPLGGKPDGRGGRIGAKIFPQTSRSAAGSTTYEKKYPGGALNLALASSPADLRLKTIKIALCDEIDEYADDLAGQGDPLKLVAGRQEMFLASGTWKRAYVSTPTVKGVSKIEKIYEAGDKRRWHVECPHCRSRFVFEWHAPFDPASHGLKFNKSFPYHAHYITPCCGSIIESWQKTAVYRTGRWVPTAPGPGKFPTYHFDALSSPFVPWDAIAKEFVEAGDDPAKLKPFYNLKLGLPFDVAGDAPDDELLMQRREDYPAERIPPGALLLTGGADVQMRGIYVEIVAWASDQQSWTIFADYLDGATTDADGGAFAELTKVYQREWPDAYNGCWRVDEFLIDSGYRTDVVYEWTRRHGAWATKGIDGWGRVPLSIATDQDIDYRGRRMRGGAKMRLVGTWPLKSKFYTYAALMPIVSGSTLTYCMRDADPSLGVRNTAAPGRSLTWSEGEAARLFKRAWRESYFGLAAAIAVAWDTQLSPGDVRALRASQLRSAASGAIFFAERGENQQAGRGRAYGPQPSRPLCLYRSPRLRSSWRRTDLPNPRPRRRGWPSLAAAAVHKRPAFEGFSSNPGARIRRGRQPDPGRFQAFRCGRGDCRRCLAGGPGARNGEYFERQ